MKDIPGYEGRYAATEDGRIWSYKKIQCWGTRKDHFLKGWTSSKGYLRATLLDDKGRRKGWYVHRLILMTYIPNPNNWPSINHKNGIKKDNSVQNLEWCTIEENSRHAYATGLAKRTRLAKRTLQPGFTKKDIASIRRMIRYLEYIIETPPTNGEALPPAQAV